jgi:hypothetical protein
MSRTRMATSPPSADARPQTNESLEGNGGSVNCKDEDEGRRMN